MSPGGCWERSWPLPSIWGSRRPQGPRRDGPPFLPRLRASEQPASRCWGRRAPCDWPISSPSCYEVNLRGCLLGDLLVSFARPAGSREEASFVCRLGEIQVGHGAQCVGRGASGRTGGQGPAGRSPPEERECGAGTPRRRRASGRTFSFPPGGGCRQPAPPTAPGAGPHCVPRVLAAGHVRGGGGGGRPCPAAAQLHPALVLPPLSHSMLPDPLPPRERRGLSAWGATGA